LISSAIQSWSRITATGARQDKDQVAAERWWIKRQPADAVGVRFFKHLSADCESARGAAPPL